MSRRYRMEAEELAAAEALGPERVPPIPRPAAGVVLARDTSRGPEVLLVRRRSDVGFAADAYVFPGGTLDAEDSDPAWSELIVPPPPAALEGAEDADGPSALTFVVAALRELFEETGVLLTAGSSETRVPTAARAALVTGERRFLDIVREWDLRLAADRLVLCARWITPEALSRRYDARFFLAEAPPDVEVRAERGELVDHVWIAPAEALQRYFDYDMSMLFPTAVTLSWLERGSGVADWRRRFLETRVQTILPRLRRIDGQVIPVLPDDPRYHEAEGDG